MDLFRSIKHQLSPRKIAYRYRQLRNAFVDDRVLWNKGISEEISFWEDVFHNPNNPHHDHYLHLANPNRPLQNELQEILAGYLSENLRILDIGAGPITPVGYIWENHKIHITAIDPLADEYKRLLATVDCTPPFPTQLCHGEEIGKHFEPESFDLIYSRNALDHAYDPMEVLRQARTLLKVGGFIFLRHNRNEGKRIYNGLHQWNFDIQNDEFILWNMKRRYVIAQELHPVTITARLWQKDNHQQIVAQIQKPL